MRWAALLVACVLVSACAVDDKEASDLQANLDWSSQSCARGSEFGCEMLATFQRRGEQMERRRSDDRAAGMLMLGVGLNMMSTASQPAYVPPPPMPTTTNCVRTMVGMNCQNY